MIPYAAYTTTRRNLTALRDARWRIMLSPATGLNSFGLPYSLDNGAWSAYTSGGAWDAGAFRSALRGCGSRADFVVVPDIVEGGLQSLKLSAEWLPFVMSLTQIALVPVQDGMTPKDVAPLLNRKVGIFVGGSTRFKEDTMIQWGDLAAKIGCWFHVGRVNTCRRIELCAAARATSFDGSSVTRYAATLPKLDRARLQGVLWKSRVNV